MPELDTAQPAVAEATPQQTPIAQTEPTVAPQSAPQTAEPVATTDRASEPIAPTTEAEKPKEEAKDHAPSLLGEALKKPAPETEPKKPETAPENKPAPAEAPAEPQQQYQPFTLPEGVTLKEDELKEVNSLFAEGNVSQEFGQKLMDRYTKEVTGLQKRMAQNQWDTWNRTQEGWRNEFLSDPEIGGNRRDTTLRSAASVLERFGTPKLREMLDFTGAGNHPEMIRLLDRIGKFTGEGRIVPATAAKPVPAKKSRADTLYDNKSE